MKLKDIAEVTGSRVVCGEDRLNEDVDTAFASDLLSDVLTLQAGNFLLITGLANIQTLRTAEMADISYIVLARRKIAPPEFIQMACENGFVVMECPYSMFRTCGLLFRAGIKPIY